MRRLVSSPQTMRCLALVRRHPPGRIFLSTKSSPGDPSNRSFEQALPLGAYYESILNNPLPYPGEKSEEPPTSVTSSEGPEPPTESPPEKPKTTRGRKKKEDKPPTPAKSSRGRKETTVASSSPPLVETTPPAPTPPPSSAEAQARVIFGSRLLGPAEQAEKLADMKTRSTLIAGVLVPPQPEEPDNCCMSGCVNCVWDRYRDEMELWASAHNEAESRLRAQEVGAAGTTTTPPNVDIRHTPSSGQSAVSMDDDGGGSEADWKLGKDFWDEELYKNVPVGIREFMKQEKRLKLKHQQQGTLGG